MNGYHVMNVPLFIVVIAEIFSICSETDALFRWKWGAKSKPKRWNWHRSESDHRCSQGQCVQAWKCPKHALSKQSMENCADLSNEPMVCCLFQNDESSYRVVGTDMYSLDFLTITSNDYFKQTASNVQKQITNSITENYGNTGAGHLNTPCVEDPWISKERPTPISSLGDILKNDQDKFNTPRSYKKVTSIYREDVPKKTSADGQKRTSFSQSIRTTSSWNKPPISESKKIIFPTERSWISKITRPPTLTTKILKRTSDSKSTKSHMWSTLSSTTITPWGYTTRRTTKTSVSPYSDKIIFPTERSWISKVTRPPTLTTKILKRTSDSKSTKSHMWSTPSSTTITPWGYTTRRTTKTPVSPYSEKFTLSTTPYESETRRNQGWGKSTHSTRSQTTRLRNTNRPLFTTSTPRTTRRYKVTTLLPNVNEFLCGIRNQRLGTRPRNRNNYGRKPVRDVVYSDIRDSTDRLPYERIVGGEEAEPFSWPWVAALYKVTSSGGNRFLSAGSLINENFVLTAAHVFTPEDLRTASFVVILGTHDAQDAVAQYLVSSVLQHPRYEQRYYYHDIALLRLSRPVIFNDYVMPVCLPSPNAPLLRDKDLEGKNVTVMGWGDDSFGGKSSRVLKEATFPIVSRISCNTSYVRVASNRFPRGITNDMLCAGDPNGGKDACQGDSGGPLTSIVNGRYTQVGIVSFGYQCGDKEFPGVYTKVAPYLTWIAENTRRNEDYSYYDD